ncbi:MAG: hypothetical protein E6Q97_07845 [Desulfurellales bacterium]|nr:MAG: hypothetical protein E6Q97_07845 [Desulfurellales bacterium]
MLTDDQLTAWGSQVVAAMSSARILDDPYAANSTYTSVVVPARGPARRHLRIDFECPSWVRGRRASVCLFDDARVAWKGPDASVREMGRALRRDAPKWHVPPQGDIEFVVGLTEHNGWEGEAWSFYLPMTSESAALKLLRAHTPSPGRDVRVTPFDPRSLAHFGSWKLSVGYAKADAAAKLAERESSGYMPRFNWCEDAGLALIDLIAEAERRDLLRWNDQSGLGMWKGRVTLTSSGQVVAQVDLCA